MRGVAVDVHEATDVEIIYKDEHDGRFCMMSSAQLRDFPRRWRATTLRPGDGVWIADMAAWASAVAAAQSKVREIARLLMQGNCLPRLSPRSVAILCTTGALMTD